MLNDLEVKAAEVHNAYLMAQYCTVWVADRHECIIFHALYGLKLAGASFWNHLADCIKTVGYKPRLADQDVWIQAKIRPENGHQYYSYVLIYVDDILCIHHNVLGMIKKINWYFKMKPGSIGDP